MESTQEKPPVSARPELFETVFETKPVELPRLLDKMRVLLGEDSPE